MNAATLRQINVVSLDGEVKELKKSADDDVFTQYDFQKIAKTKVLTMQEIFIQEKGKEALRAMEITIKSERVKDEPKLDRRARGQKPDDDDQDDEPV